MVEVPRMVTPFCAWEHAHVPPGCVMAARTCTRRERRCFVAELSRGAPCLDAVLTDLACDPAHARRDSPNRACVIELDHLRLHNGDYRVSAADGCVMSSEVGGDGLGVAGWLITRSASSAKARRMSG